jgi:Flp pilus assembly protein TadD
MGVVYRALQRSLKRTVVYTACLAADGGLPADELVRLAHTDERDADSLPILGAAQYRAGQYAQAVATLEKAARLAGGRVMNWTKLFLAMAYQQQNQPASARGWLGRAVLADNADWEERLVYERLHREAAQLLKMAPRNGH